MRLKCILKAQMPKVREPLARSIKALGSAIRSLFKLAPGAAIVIVGVSTYFVSIIAENSGLHELFATLIVFFVSLIVYVRSKNFGEGALALVAGLLAVFSVEWDQQSFIIFASTWIGFTVLAFLVSSVRIAMKVESLRRRAALRIDSRMYKEVESLLSKSASRSELKMLSPTERAEVQLVFAYANVELGAMDDALVFAEQLHVITDIDLKRVASFVADLVAIIGRKRRITEVLDSIYTLVNEAPYPPEDIFDVVRRTKYIVLRNILTSDEYFSRIVDLMTNGVDPGDIHERLLQNCS